MQSREPMFNAPAVVVVVLALLVGVHAVLAVLSDQQWAIVVEALALIPARYSGHASQLVGGQVTAVTSLLTHQLVHGDVAHLVLNSAWLLAFGSAVAQRVGAVRLVLLAAASGIAGGATFIALHYGEPTSLVGASGALSGLMGAAFRFLFSALDESGSEAFRSRPAAIRRMSVGELMRDPRGRLAVLLWVGLNFVTAWLAPLFTSAGAIAWEAHLGGFAFGLLSFGLFDRRPPADEPGPKWH